MFKDALPVKLFLKNNNCGILFPPKKAAPGKMGVYGCNPGKGIPSNEAVSAKPAA
jgi:hypothetical protein